MGDLYSITKTNIVVGVTFGGNSAKFRETRAVMFTVHAVFLF